MADDRRTETADTASVTTWPFRTPKWVTDHIPLVATGLVFLYLAVRLARVSRLSGETARALVSSADVTTVVVAAIIPAVVIAWFGLLFTTTVISIDYALTSRRFTGYHAFYLVVLAGAVVVVPFGLLLFTAIMALLYLVASLAAERAGMHGKLNRRGEIAMGIAGFVFLAAIADMWLPPERIGLADQREVVAYWIGQDATWTTLMLEADRQILIVPTDTIEARQVCDLGPDLVGGRSLLDVLQDPAQPEYSPCFPQSPARHG